jgi:hypothetical protein
MDQRHPLTIVAAGVAFALALVASAGPAAAKGGELRTPEPLLRRETGGEVAIRAAHGRVPEEWGLEECDGAGCLPKPCRARGIGWLGLSTEAAVGEGQFEIYPRTRAPVTFAASGTFGTNVDHPVGWIVVRTGKQTSEVTARFRYGGRDSMRPVNGWAVLAAPLHDVPAVQVLPPTATITARGADGSELAAVTVDGDTPWPGPPEPCVEPLPQRMPELTGRVPADEDAARADVAATYLAAYTREGVNLGVASVQGGAALAEVAELAVQRFPQYVNKIRVDIQDIQFVDRDEAAIRFSLEVQGDDGTTSELGINGVGRAVHRSGRWLVSRSTFCSVLAVGGIYCPLPRERARQADDRSASPSGLDSTTR